MRLNKEDELSGSYLASGNPYSLPTEVVCKHLRLYAVGRYLASSLDSLAQRPGAGLGVEGVRHELVLRRVHDERAAPHVASDAQE